MRSRSSSNSARRNAEVVIMLSAGMGIADQSGTRKTVVAELPGVNTTESTSPAT